MISYELFLSLSEDIRNDPCFEQCSRLDAVGDKPMNIKSLLLGCLRYIGRAWTYDDIYEANGVSISTNRQFILCFIECSTVLYKKWVIDLRMNRNINEQKSIYRQDGFNGCMGSSDGTHISILKCTQWASNTSTYNVAVDHSRRILASTTGH